MGINSGFKGLNKAVCASSVKA